MRHGEAEPASSADSERQLTPAGSRANRAVAERLREMGAMFELALVSPYLRARQTAEDLEAVLGNLNFRESRLVLPDSPPDAVIEFLSDDCNADWRVLMVGHNPLLSRATSLLVEGNTNADYYLATSELICLRAEIPAAGCASIRFGLHSSTSRA